MSQNIGNFRSSNDDAYIAMLQQASMMHRLDFNPNHGMPFTLGSNLTHGISVNFDWTSNSPAEFPTTNRSTGYCTRGIMPRLSRGSSSHTKKNIEQEYGQTNVPQSSMTSQNNHESSYLSICSRDRKESLKMDELQGERISNMVYDPSYVEKDKPVDPFLRMLKENPDFCNLKGSK